jgi:hypothetical protein
MENFEDIRPYRDHEVKEVIQKLLSDRDFFKSLSGFQYPRMQKVLPFFTKLMVKKYLQKKLSNVYTINDFQNAISKYVDKVLEKSTAELNVTGLDTLTSDNAYLFISNHRDIVMDPALISYLLHKSKHGTTEIAIGDNLLKKEFVSHLMRLNKSFIVKRSAKGREKLLATKTLSEYINYAIEHKDNVWIAQREGRAKDGLDKTDPTIIKMFHLGKRGGEGDPVSLKDCIDNLHIIPVSISYEYDPCDELKARELYEIDTNGKFEKDQHSDIISIAKGIEGFKGNIELSFGNQIVALDSDPNRIALQIDQQIVGNYKLHPSNYIAYEKLITEDPCIGPDLKTLGVDLTLINSKRSEFEARLEAIPTELRPYVLKMYANPVINKNSLSLI